MAAAGCCAAGGTNEAAECVGHAAGGPAANEEGFACLRKLPSLARLLFISPRLSSFSQTLGEESMMRVNLSNTRQG